MYGALPKIERSFDLEHEGSVTGFSYKGTFTVRCVLNIQLKHQVELDRTRLMSDMRNPTPELEGIATALAELKARIIEGPAWWKDSNAGLNLLDEDAIGTLYTKCQEMEIAWRKELKVKAEATQGN
jgi:hypothetical protein